MHGIHGARKVDYDQWESSWDEQQEPRQGGLAKHPSEPLSWP